MPIWLTRLLIHLVVSLALGAAIAAGVAWYALFRVEQGVAPYNGVLHVREGRFWMVAFDRAFGLRWVNLDRLHRASINSSLEVPAVPVWAEPPTAADGLELPSAEGAWRVGSLAIGWPAPMRVRQWSEWEADRLFVPHSEVDDDGFTISKMAKHAFEPMAIARDVTLWDGVAINVLFFAFPIFLVLVPRLVRGPARPVTPQAAAAGPR